MKNELTTSQSPPQSCSSEYSLSSEHSNVESESTGSKANTMAEELYTVVARKGVEVTVAVEFPVEADPKAEEGFNELLKSIWMKKIEIGYRQI